MRLNWQKDAERKGKQNSEKKIRLMMGWLPPTIVTIGFVLTTPRESPPTMTTGAMKTTRQRNFGQTFFDSGQLMTLIEHE